MPSEESAWLTAHSAMHASKVRDAAETVLDFSVNKGRSAAPVIRTTVLLLDLAVTLQMQPVSMTDQAVQQQLL